MKEVSQIVGGLKMLEIKIDNDAQKIKELEDKFGSLPPNFQQLPQFEINNSTLIKEVYFNNENKKFSVKLWHCTHPSYGDLAVKVYDKKLTNYDMSRVRKEIQILETLSERSTPQNCFIKFYAKATKPKRIWFAMEYHELTLMKEMTEMKKINKKFTEGQLICFAKELLSAFAVMESIKIYHKNIKPHNILVTSEGRLKIIGFGVFGSGENFFNDYFIQGSRGYMAPEIEEARIDKIKEKFRFKRGKAGVFSLGIILLQLYCFEDLSTMNYPENNEKLMEKVNEIEYYWLSKLLIKMLQLNFNDRPSFIRCLKDIPCSNTDLL